MSTRKVAELPGKRVRAINRVAVFNPAKGLNNLGSPNLIDDKEWADLNNIEFDEGGVARKRMGFTTYSASVTAANGLGFLLNDSYDQVCTIDGDTFKYTTGTSWTSVSTITFVAARETNMTQARGSLYIWNGTNGGSKWDGATLSRPGTMPSAKFSIYYNSYHICAGTSTKKNRVFISAQTDSSEFTRISTDTKLNNSTEVPGATVFASGTAANFIDVLPDDGDSIRGLGIFQDTVIIFKQFSIYSMTLDATGTPTISLITRAAGCVAHKSIVNVENDLYFLSREGVRVLGNQANYFNSIRTSILSRQIQPIIDTIDEPNYEKANATYFNKQYILTVATTSGNPDKTLTYHTEHNGWTVWDNINSDTLLRYINSSSEQKLLFLSHEGTQVYQFTPGVYTDNGTPISSYLLSKVFDFKNPDITKYFVDLGLMFRTISGQISLEIYTEGNVLFGGEVGLAGNPVTDGMGLTMLGETMLGLGGGTSGTAEAFADTIRRVVIKTRSTTIRFKISNERNNENFVLLGYIHAFYPYSHFLFDSTKKIYL